MFKIFPQITLVATCFACCISVFPTLYMTNQVIKRPINSDFDRPLRPSKLKKLFRTLGIFVDHTCLSQMFISIFIPIYHMMKLNDPIARSDGIAGNTASNFDCTCYFT